MELIVIGCFGQRSSYILATKIGKLEGNESVYVDSLSNILETYEQLANTYECCVAYGSISMIDSRYNVRMYDLQHRISQIWVAPQAQYMMHRISTSFVGSDIVPHMIDQRVFGIMDAQALWEAIVKTR
ncbi:hypothetical protein ACWG0P_10400 [Amedibacillus sp. YH-ame6]